MEVYNVPGLTYSKDLASVALCVPELRQEVLGHFSSTVIEVADVMTVVALSSLCVF